MKSIGIVICNYNKCDYITRCIQSVLESNTTDFDLFVVDNASTDRSVEEIKRQFPTQVTLFENKENLGGSGGFNRGIKELMKRGYEYIMCLDNDVLVDENAVIALKQFLELHQEVGMVGSIVYHMHAPDYIQQYGLNIDFNHCSAKTLYADQPLTTTVPDFLYCDTVAACSLMVRTSALNKVGAIPEENFIYWDDMEWGYKFKLAGYKVAACKQSAVLHEMGSNVRKPTTFTTYYMWRNRIQFFMDYTHPEDYELMSEVMLRDVFDGIYEAKYQNEHNVAASIMAAYQDALSHKHGKALEGRILENDGNALHIKELLASASSCSLDPTEQEVIKLILSMKPEIKITTKEENADIHFKYCPYIMDVKDFSGTYCYYDQRGNVMYTKEDIQMVRHYDDAFALFLYMNKPYFLQAILDK